jgi:hypothetical protein
LTAASVEVGVGRALGGGVAVIEGDDGDATDGVDGVGDAGPTGCA